MDHIGKKRLNNKVTLAKHKPMVPVPQQMSTTEESFFTSLISIALWYKISAPAVFIYKPKSFTTSFYETMKTKESLV